MSTFPILPYRKRSTCRLCGGYSLREVLRLADSPPANAFCKTREEAVALPRAPLYLARCMSCGHVQLPVVLDPKALFGDYVYVSGTSPSFVQHFRRYAEAVVTELPSDSLVVDVGSNDGTLLRQIKEVRPDAYVLGVDPAVKIAQQATRDGIFTVPQFFTTEMAKGIRSHYGPAALVTANNVFAHADDLAEIALGAKELLAPDGRFVFEVQYLVDMVAGGLFDMVYHEHLSYHHVAPLVPFFKKLGMSLVDVQRVPTHGGSIRCTVVPRGARQPSGNVDRAIEHERDALGDDPWPAMQARVRSSASALATVLAWADGENKKVVGYGAPAKMATLCHTFGITDQLAYVVDDSPWKQGLYCPGTGIPVRGELGENVDAVLIFAWNFADQIAAKLRATGFTGRIYSPLPTLKEHA